MILILSITLICQTAERTPDLYTAVTAETQAGKDVIRLDLRDAHVKDVLRMLCDRARINLVIDGSVPDKKITILLHHVTYEQAIFTVLKMTGLAYRWDHQLVEVGPRTGHRRLGP